MTNTNRGQSPDGAHHGMKPLQSLRKVLGGNDSTSAAPQSRDEMRTYLESAPDAPASYDDAARYIGRVMLDYFRAHPESLAMDAYAAFDAAMPSLEGTPIDGVTGFMVGWGVNAARYALDAPPVANPAIIDIDINNKS